MSQRTVWTIAVLTLVVGAVIGAGLTVGALGVAAPGTDSPATDEPTDGPLAGNLSQFDDVDPAALLDGQGTIRQFGTTEAFEDYVESARRSIGRGGFAAGTRGGVEGGENGGGNGNGAATRADAAAPPPSSTGPERVAETNVQVEGLDEPDVVKTDGENFYYAPLGDRQRIPPIAFDEDTQERRGFPAPSTHVVDAGEPGGPGALAEMNTSGQLLQTGDTLIVFEEHADSIVGYDVSDPANPVERWRQPLNDRLVTARETGGQLYIVTQTLLGTAASCPIQPLGGDEAIDCGDVYRPDAQTDADATYTAFSIDAESGAVEDSVSFVGTGENSVVYMSPDSLYLTYTTGVSQVDLLASWIQESDLPPEQLEKRVLEVRSYDISEGSVRREIGMAIDAWFESLPENEQDRTREQFSDGYRSYLSDHQKQLAQTTVVHVEVDDGDLTVGETGTVPGEPLDQFALDEYEDTLRITTTIPRAGDAESINHLYVLDSESLDRESEVTGMGEDQRVYAVRYVGDTAYLITFRRVDPFYVVDFEEPTEPELLGDLKLPGFSTYLHPIDDDTVLGIGEENRQVKAVLFDVTDPTDPEVGDDLVLDERWSAIDNTHHAFLIDRRNGVFFLPAEEKGLVVNYTGGELEVVAEVQAESRVSRARYVDDYLYVFAGEEVIVLDQSDWERTTTLTLGESN